MRVPKQKTAWQQWGLSLVVLVVLADAVWVLLGHNFSPPVNAPRGQQPLASVPASVPVSVPVSVPAPSPVVAVSAVAAPASAVPASAASKPSPALASTPTPAPTPAPKVASVSAAVEKSASPTVATAKTSASARWVQGLPPESRVVVHLQAATLREAENFRQSHQPLLANARILQTTESGARSVRYLLVSGPFRSPERVHNYMQRLDWRDKASSLTRDKLLEQVTR